MFKANSLHHFMPSTPFTSSPNLVPIQPATRPYTLVYNQHNQPQRKYEFTLAEYQRDFPLFEWRRNIHHPIPKISHITLCKDAQQRPIVSILCEHISLGFSDLRCLKIQQLIYCLSEMLLGYQEIFARLGFVCVEPKLVGLNTRGQVLLWVSQNLLTPVSQYPKISTEKQIVLKIVQLLETKAQQNSHAFFVELRKLEPKFKTVLEFIMAFKHKNKLKIIPKISVVENKSGSEKMVVSNTFSNKTEKEVLSNPFQPITQMKTSSQICASQSQSQFLASSKVTSNQCSIPRNNHTRNRTSIVMQSDMIHTPTNPHLNNSVHDKSAPKVNFSYSQKRQQINTPKQSLVVRDYTSDKNMPLLNKIHSEGNPIKEFTLEDKRTVNEPLEKARKRGRNNPNKKIVRIYTASYIPSNDVLYLQTELDMKKSTASHFSQSSFTSKDKLLGENFCHNKTSMTTNHRSAVTQSFQSLGKSSNDDEYYTRKNDLFTSNHSNRTTYSIIRSSFVENEPAKNTVSFVVGNVSHQSQPLSPLNHGTFMNSTSHIHSLHNQKRKDMYTFGGLLTPLLQQTHELKHSTTIPQPSPTSISFQNLPHQPKPTLIPQQINTKSIDQLYNNLYFSSEKKSMIMEEYSIKLSPVKEELHSHVKEDVSSEVKESFVIGLDETKGHKPLSHAKKPPSDRTFNDFSTPKLTPNPNTFDYNQWRGIKGLLSESNVYELKESIHCGPEIRSPVNNIKLQLLDKFGREIGQSILPGTPSAGHQSRTHSVYTIADEHSVEYY